MDELPRDVFSQQSFAYHSDRDGFLLYGLGDNREDDGGSNAALNVMGGRWFLEDEEAAQFGPIPSTADDFGIRIPVVHPAD
jgi:hypothetical protein